MSQVLGTFFHFQTPMVPSAGFELPTAHSLSVWHRPCGHCCSSTWQSRGAPGVIWKANILQRAWQQESRFYKMHPKLLSALRLSWDLSLSIQRRINTRITYSKPGKVWGSRAENYWGRPKQRMGELQYLLHYPVRETACH